MKGEGVSRGGMRAGMVYVAGVAILLVAVLSRSGYVSARLPGAILILPLLAGAVVLIAAARWPAVALPVGAIVPFLPAQPLPVLFGLLLVVVSAISAFPAATTLARKGSGVLLALFGLTVLLGLLLQNYAASGGIPTMLAMSYACGLGICAALAGSDGLLVLISTAGVGVYAAVRAALTTDLLQERALSVAGVNANGLGYLCALGMVAALCLVFGPGLALLIRSAAVVAAIVCAQGIYDTGSRGALVAGLSGVVAVVLGRFLDRTVRQQILALVALAMVTFLVAPPAMAALIRLTGRRQQGAALNLLQRQDALQYALHQGAGHPLTGVGIARLAEISHDDVNSGLALNAHDTFAGVFAESGVFAFAAMLVVCVVALLNSRARNPVRLSGAVVTVIAGGVSLQWWGDGLTGHLSLMLLGAALGHAARPTKDELVAAEPARAGRQLDE